MLVRYETPWILSDSVKGLLDKYLYSPLKTLERVISVEQGTILSYG